MPRQVVQIMISTWEIECCAPPPVIGAESTWQLQFAAADDELAHDDIWTVTHDGPGSAFLDRAGIHAVWNGYGTPPPPPGIHTLRGLLRGTVHGTDPECSVEVTGRVQRIRIVSQELEPNRAGDRTVRYRPGTRSLRDVRESPRWFHDDPADPADPADAGRADTGILIDLAVPTS